MTLLDVVLQGGALLLGVAAVLVLVKVLFVGLDRRRRPREDGDVQEHQSRTRAGTGYRM